MASACGVLRARYERRLVVTPCAGKTVGVSHARRCRSCVVRYRGEGEVDAVVSATACVHRRLPAAPPRRALGVEASARGLVRGRPRGGFNASCHPSCPSCPSCPCRRCPCPCRRCPTLTKLPIPRGHECQRRRRDPSAVPTTLVTPGHPAAAGRDEQERDAETPPDGLRGSVGFEHIPV